MISSAIVALAAQAAIYTQTPPVLPQSLRTGSLAACSPITLEAAEKCLSAALSPGDLLIVQDRISARRFRPNLDCQIEEEWRLTDPNSPMARVMQEKLGIDHPDLAAGMIISDLEARAKGSRLPFGKIRADLRTAAPPPSDECEKLRENTAAQEQNNAH
jgi:hypothetical protein